MEGIWREGTGWERVSGGKWRSLGLGQEDGWMAMRMNGNLQLMGGGLGRGHLQEEAEICNRGCTQESVEVSLAVTQSTGIWGLRVFFVLLS